jgi:hypothetical protein
METVALSGQVQFSFHAFSIDFSSEICLDTHGAQAKKKAHGGESPWARASFIELEVFCSAYLAKHCARFDSLSA